MFDWGNSLLLFSLTYTERLKLSFYVWSINILLSLR